MSNDAEQWRIRALTAEHLLEHERAEIERLLDYAAELEEKLGETEQETVSMTGRFLAMYADFEETAGPIPEWVLEASKQTDAERKHARRMRELAADRALFEEFMRGDKWPPLEVRSDKWPPLEVRSEYRKPKRDKGTAAQPAKNKHHAKFTKEQWRK